MNPNDKGQVNESAKLAAYNREKHLEDLRNILKTRSGRRYVWNLMAECKPFINAMTGNSQTFFNLGKQYIGQMLFMDIMEAAPDDFALMQYEAANDLLIDNQIIEKAAE